jgi:hypothetical protein
MDLKKFTESKFVKSENVKQGDVMTFLDGGTEKEMSGKKVVNFNVEVNGEEKIYSPNKTALVALGDAWGTNGDDYIGKKAKILFVKVRNPQNGEIVDSIALAPQTAIKDMPENLTPEELAEKL